MSDAETNLGIFLQDLSRSDRLLVLSWFAMQRESDGWFRTADVAQLNQGLRLPSAGNVSQFLGKIRDTDKYVISSGGGGSLRWSLTPHGKRDAQAILAEANITAAPHVNAMFTADFLRTSYPTLPAELAPAELLPKIRPFLAEYPFDTNVFLMTRFPTRVEADPIADVIAAMRDAVAEHDLTLHVAFDRAIHDELWPNIAAHMWSCRYGLGLLETTLASSVSEDQKLDPATLKALTLNDNVLLELGSMLTLGRRCKILKDEGAPQPPSDLTSQIYRTVDLSDLSSVVAAVHSWVVDDLLIR